MRSHIRSFVLTTFMLFTLLAHADNKSIDFKALGFDEKTTQANTQEAELLKTRREKLQRHQLMAYATLALATATVLTAPDDEPPSDAHKALGLSTAASYAYTAYLSLSAPELESHDKSGYGMTVHKALVWVHLPGMILTPIAGLMAEQAMEKHKEPSGLGKYKKDLAWTTVGALGLAALSVTFEF